MKNWTEQLQLCIILGILAVPIFAKAIPTGRPAKEQNYILEGYIKDGDASILIFRIQPNDAASNNTRQGKQEGEEEESVAGPTSSPFIPAVIPALTKILTGIITGNLNDIFHGSTSFAPQNISHIIDTVYNQVVGLPPPTLTSTQAPLIETTPKTDPTTTAPPPPPPTRKPTRASTVTRVPELSYVYAGPTSGLGSSGSIVFTTPRRVSTEDDEDESDVKIKFNYVNF